MLEILKYPDPRLKQVSKPVEKFDAKLHKLLDDMAVTMYAANGVGLAAAQVGEFIRLFLVDISGQDPSHPQLMEFINPVLTNGEGRAVYEEGCLSVPGIAEDVVRKQKITISYQDRFGEKKQLDAEGILAVALQHENDHLDGVLFVERLSPLKRRFLKRKLEKVVAI